jgi:triphosphoribosyl-dephospho-CoA synthetase
MIKVIYHLLPGCRVPVERLDALLDLQNLLQVRLTLLHQVGPDRPLLHPRGGPGADEVHLRAQVLASQQANLEKKRTQKLEK